MVPLPALRGRPREHEDRPACAQEERPRHDYRGTWLHADNGNPMKGATFAVWLATIADAREWLGDFIHWYNTERRHSGIGYVTREQRRTGQSSRLLELRNQTLL